MKKKTLTGVIFVIVTAAFSLLFIFMPKNDFSVNEKRVLSQKPDLTISGIFDGSFMEELDTYLEDHFPFRDFFVGINSYFKLLLGENGSSGVYKCKDGYLIAKQSEIDFEKTEKNINTLLKFADKTSLPYKLIVVPSAGYIMQNVMPAVSTQYADGEILDLCASMCPDNFIDLRSSFSENSDKIQLYYKTDHHLTSQGAMLMYGEYCNALGLEKKDFYLSQTKSGFYGTAYSKSGLWLTKSDDIEIYTSGNTDFSVTITDGEQSDEYNSLYFLSHFDEPDKYPVFLDGNHALVTVKNNKCHNGRRLIIIKDSFAHCFATFLIENYEEICMVDLRYFRQSVTDVIKNENINELAFLYSAENLASSTDIPWLSLL